MFKKSPSEFGKAQGDRIFICSSREAKSMRVFVAACLFGLLIGSVGCVTNNWSSPLFRHRLDNVEREPEIPLGIGDRRTPKRVGIYPRAEAIEKRLGL